MYIVVKDFNKQGCICFKCKSKADMPSIPNLLNSYVELSRIQVVVLNDPNAYGEYAPYKFIDDLGDFIKEALKM